MIVMIQHLFRQRGLAGMVACTWGIMIGIAVPITLVAILLGVLNAGFYATLAGCLTVSFLGLFFVLPLIRKEYYKPNAKTLLDILELFALTILRGIFAPIYPVYRFVELHLRRYLLIWRVHRLNKTILETGVSIREFQKTIVANKWKMRELAKQHGHSRPAIARRQAQLEQAHHTALDLDQRNQELLWNCRALAQRLGMKLREDPTAYSVQETKTVFILVKTEIRYLYSPALC